MVLPRLFVKAAAPIASAFLILAGIIQLRAQLWTVGAICIVLAMLGFVASMRLLEAAPFTGTEIETLHPWLTPVVLWSTVISLLILSTFYVADSVKDAATDRVAAVAWLSSVVLAMFTIWRKGLRPISRQALLEKLWAHDAEFVALLMLLILAFGVRFIDLAGHPYPWSGDEASVGTEARRILNGEITNFFETGWSSQPNWSFVPAAVSETIFGQNMFAVRVPSVLAGTLAVLVLYLAARELFNPAIALMAAAFLATLPYNVHFSRIGVNNVMDSLMSGLIFWLIARAMKTDDSRYSYSAGAVSGLCIYTYAGTRLALILGGIAILFLIVRHRKSLFSPGKHLMLFSLGILISAAPQAAFFARHRDIFLGRFGQEGIFLNGWLARQVAETGKSTWEILFSQFSRTIMVFIASSAPGNFFNSPIPYLTVLGSILFLLGMGYALAFALQPRHFILLIWFWAAVLFGGILTLNPPANTRLLMTSPAVALLMGLGLYKVMEYLQRLRVTPARPALWISALIVVTITFQNVNFYLGEYKNQYYFQDANGEYAMEVALVANARGKDFQIFLMGAPRVFSDFPTLTFIAPENPHTDLSAEGISTLQLLPDREAGFFAIPENRVLIQDIIRKYPGGENGYVYRRSQPNEILFEYYIVRP